MANEQAEVAVTIRWADMDAYGHMRHSAYADWATFGRTEWLARAGLAPVLFQREGVAPITLEETTTFLQEVRLGEVLLLSMRLLAASADGSRFVHEVAFRRGDASVARYRMTGAWFDLKTRRIVPPPERIAEGCARLSRAEPLAALG